MQIAPRCAMHERLPWQGLPLARRKVNNFRYSRWEKLRGYCERPPAGSAVMVIEQVPEKPRPTLSEFFLLFCRIGLTSFGGGLSGWLFREMVEKKHWLGEDEFFDAFALCQALPGINVSNMAVWTGYRLLGTRGAFAGVAGIVLPPSIVIIFIGMLFSSLAGFSFTPVVLTGATAAAVALPLSMGLTLAWRIPRMVLPMAVMIGTFLAIGLFKLPVLWVLPVAGAISVLATHFQTSRT
jgi:chromate transporter